MTILNVYLPAGTNMAQTSTDSIQTQMLNEEIKLAGCEGATDEGCPVPKWIIQHSNQKERYIVIFKTR